MFRKLDVDLPLGEVVATPGVLRSVSEEDRESALERHRSGDWGEPFDGEDWEANNRAVQEGKQVLSTYVTKDRAGKFVWFWVVTEWDRSVTTLMLPEEY